MQTPLLSVEDVVKQTRPLTSGSSEFSGGYQENAGGSSPLGRRNNRCRSTGTGKRTGPVGNLIEGEAGAWEGRRLLTACQILKTCAKVFEPPIDSEEEVILVF